MNPYEPPQTTTTKPWYSRRPTPRVFVVVMLASSFVAGLSVTTLPAVAIANAIAIYCNWYSLFRILEQRCD